MLMINNFIKNSLMELSRRQLCECCIVKLNQAGICVAASSNMACT
jgi:hypothetical protein